MKKIILILSFFLLLISSFATAKPQLKDNYLNPPQGPIGTEFIYKVTYFDATGKIPEYVKIFIDSSPHDMQKISGTPKNGELYQYTLLGSKENAGYHNYYFEASDGTETVKLFDPTTADQTYGGPSILATELKDNKIYLFSRNFAEPLWEYSIGKDWAINVDVSADGNTIAAKTSDYIYVFSKEGKLRWKLLTGNGNADNIDPSGFVKVLGDKIFAGGQGKVRLFNSNSKNPLWEYNTAASTYNIQTSSDGKYVAVGRFDDRLDLVDGTNGKVIWHYDVDGGFHAVGISSDGNYIIGGTHCPDRTGYLFSKDSNKPIWKKYLNDVGSPAWCGTISADGNYIVFGLDGGGPENPNIFFFNKNSAEPVWTYNAKYWVRSVALSQDGSLIVAGTGDKNVIVFSKESNVPLWEYQANDKVGAVDISTDGKYIVAGTKSKQLLLFSKESNVPIWVFQASEWVNWVKIKGEYIVASTGAPQYIYEGHNENIHENMDELITESYLSKCGNGICDPPDETEDNCCEDCCRSKIEAVENKTYKEIKITNYDQESFCTQFNGNREACYAHPKECNWIQKEEVCDDLVVKKEIVEKEELVEDNKKLEEKSFFGKIIDFFRRLFG